MPVPVTCPHCAAAGTVPDEARGKRVRCTLCGKAFPAPPAAFRADDIEVLPVEPAPSRPAYRDPRDDYRDHERPRFRCRFCGTTRPPEMRVRTSVGGWILFAVLSFTCFGLLLSWVALFMTEEVAVCSECGVRLGG